MIRVLETFVSERPKILSKKYHYSKTVSAILGKTRILFQDTKYTYCSSIAQSVRAVRRSRKVGGSNPFGIWWVNIFNLFKRSNKKVDTIIYTIKEERLVQGNKQITAHLPKVGSPVCSAAFKFLPRAPARPRTYAWLSFSTN